MMKLEDLQSGVALRGLVPDALVTVVTVQWFGSEALELIYKTSTGKLAYELLYRHDEPRLGIVEAGRPGSFDGDGEATLHKAVRDYVREEFNGADALQNDKRAGTVGFALTILQRRLASSPEPIYQSLGRRRERLESKLRQIELLKRGAEVATVIAAVVPALEDDDREDLEEGPDSELEEVEEQVFDQAAGARTITVTKNEILHPLSKPGDYIHAIVDLTNGAAQPRVLSVRRPFQRERDFGVTSVNYDFEQLTLHGEEPA